MSLTVGDTAPALTGTCASGTQPASLVGATVELHVKKPDGTILTKSAAITDAAAGAWSYQWLTGEVDKDGSWNVEAQVTFSSGLIQTFGPTSFYVQAQIA